MVIMDGFKRSWVDHGKDYKSKDYVPLAEREDWDGKVEVLPTFKHDLEPQKKADQHFVIKRK